MLKAPFHFDRWLRLQPKAKREEVNDQLDRGGVAVWQEETQTYIVSFDEPKADQQSR